MFTEKTVYELKTICMLNDIEYPKNVKKADLVKLIEDAGINYEDYESKVEDTKEYVEAEVVVKDQVVVQEKQEVETIKEDNLVIKMVHPRGALNVGNGIIFTLEEPFKVFPRSKAEEVLRRAKSEVREATPEEVARFYGVI